MSREIFELNSSATEILTLYPDRGDSTYALSSQVLDSYLNSVGDTESQYCPIIDVKLLDGSTDLSGSGLYTREDDLTVDMTTYPNYPGQAQYPPKQITLNASSDFDQTVTIEYTAQSG